jgi:prophage regulatory protein
MKQQGQTDFSTLGQSSKRIIRLPEVMHLTALPRASIYQKVGEGVFPRPIPLGRRCVGWLEAEVIGWIDHRASLR